MSMVHFDSLIRSTLGRRLAMALGCKIADEHQVCIAHDTLTTIVVMCYCGWTLRASYARLREMAGPGAMADWFAERLEEHAADVIALHQPTLSDMADWGWFNPEAGA